MQQVSFISKSAATPPSGPTTNKQSGRSTLTVAKQTTEVRNDCGWKRQAGPFNEAGVFSADLNKCQQDFLENICCC